MSVSIRQIWDQEITAVSISKLNTEIKQNVIDFIFTAQEEGILLRIPTNGGYIPYSEQQDKFTKGETKVKGGNTYHNFGLAFDVLPLRDKRTTLDPRSEDGKRTLTNDQWERVGQIGKLFGFEWGGEWMDNDMSHPKFDSAHFQFPRGLASLEYLNNLRKSQRQDLIVLPEEIKSEFNIQ